MFSANQPWQVVPKRSDRWRARVVDCFGHLVIPDVNINDAHSIVMAMLPRPTNGGTK
jgi:hypothetical protein